MTSSPERQWWVIFHEPTPASQEIVAVEPPPVGKEAQHERCDQMAAAGHQAYIITAPDEGTAGDIALRIWAEQLVSSPERLAAANAYIAANQSAN